MVELSRIGDASKEACAFRVQAARTVAQQSTGMNKTQFCTACGVSLTSYLNAEAGLSYPSRAVMLYLHRHHRIDFNFLLHGDMLQLPADVQQALAAAMAEIEAERE